MAGQIEQQPQRGTLRFIVLTAWFALLVRIFHGALGHSGQSVSFEMGRYVGHALIIGTLVAITLGGLRLLAKHQQKAPPSGYLVLGVTTAIVLFLMYAFTSTKRSIDESTAQPPPATIADTFDLSTAAPVAPELTKPPTTASGVPPWGYGCVSGTAYNPSTKFCETTVQTPEAKWATAITRWKRENTAFLASDLRRQAMIETLDKWSQVQPALSDAELIQRAQWEAFQKTGWGGPNTTDRTPKPLTASDKAIAQHYLDTAFDENGKPIPIDWKP